MTVEEAIEVLKGYPGTMELKLEVCSNEVTGYTDDGKEYIYIDVEELTEDPEVPNTVIIKI